MDWVVTIVSIFIAASARLLPLLNGIITSSMSIRFAVPAVRDLGRDLEQIETFRLQYPEDATRQFNDQSFKV